MIKGYEGVNTWIFDLDDTLYPGSSNWEERAFSKFFNYVEERYGINAEEAKNLDREFDKLGFYLKGWIEHIPHFDIHHWWAEIDKVDASDTPVCQLTQEKVRQLPGSKILFTNGHPSHADKFLNHLGLTNHFDEVIAIDVDDIKNSRFKPNPDIYHEIMAKMNVEGKNCAMFEDNINNLKTAHNLGMRTVLVNNAQDLTHLEHVHEQFPTFTHWLEMYMR